jgi:hypothetical protein
VKWINKLNEYIQNDQYSHNLLLVMIMPSQKDEKNIFDYILNDIKLYWIEQYAFSN